MPKSADQITSDLKPLKGGESWYIIVTYPGRMQEHIPGFRSDAEAEQWLSDKGRQTWLRARGDFSIKYPGEQVLKTADDCMITHARPVEETLGALSPERIMTLFIGEFYYDTQRPAMRANGECANALTRDSQPTGNLEPEAVLSGVLI